MPKNEKPETAEADAAKAEATEEPISVEHNGVTYTVDPECRDDVELVEAIANLAEGDTTMLPRIVRGVIGDADYERFKTANRNPASGRVSVVALNELFDLLDTALGE